VTAPPDCIFCAIVAGSAPSETVFEDERTLAFLDVNPATDGHTLVVPKAHAADLFELEDPDAAAVWRTVRHVAAGIRDALEPDGLNLLQGNGRAAFQSVFHLHVHLVPRWADDGIRLPWVPRPGDRARIAQVAGMLRPAL